MFSDGENAWVKLLPYMILCGQPGKALVVIRKPNRTLSRCGCCRLLDFSQWRHVCNDASLVGGSPRCACDFVNT